MVYREAVYGQGAPREGREEGIYTRVVPPPTIPGRAICASYLLQTMGEQGAICASLPTNLSTGRHTRVYKPLVLRYREAYPGV